MQAKQMQVKQMQVKQNDKRRRCRRSKYRRSKIAGQTVRQPFTHVSEAGAETGMEQDNPQNGL